MGDESRIKIRESCRQFGGGSSDERMRVAKNFIKEFVKNATPPMSLDESDEAWTRSVRGRFIEICPADCYALPNDSRTAKGEYLVDYTWAEVANGRRVLLACESEWGSGWNGRTHWFPVEHDFEKLLAIKAPFKVLIFSSCCKPHSPQRSPEIDFSYEYAKQERLKASLENYWHHIPGEVYIFIDFPATGVKDGPGKYQSFIWLVQEHGKANVKFVDGPKGDLPLRPPEP